MTDLLVGVQTDTRDRGIGLEDPLAGQVPHLEVPDPGRAILAPCEHPPTVLLQHHVSSLRITYGQAREAHRG